MFISERFLKAKCFLFCRYMSDNDPERREHMINHFHKISKY